MSSQRRLAAAAPRARDRQRPLHAAAACHSRSHQGVARHGAVGTGGAGAVTGAPLGCFRVEGLGTATAWPRSTGATDTAAARTSPLGPRWRGLRRTQRSLWHCSGWREPTATLRSSPNFRQKLRLMDSTANKVVSSGAAPLQPFEGQYAVFRPRRYAWRGGLPLSPHAASHERHPETRRCPPSTALRSDLRQIPVGDFAAGHEDNARKTT
jgi:hypothetical protein